jgi:hypothetical protein
MAEKKRHNSWFGICRHRTKNRTWFGNDTFFGSPALIVAQKQMVMTTAFWFDIAIRRMPLGTSSGRWRTRFFPRGCFGSFKRLFQTFRYRIFKMKAIPTTYRGVNMPDPARYPPQRAGIGAVS